MIEQPDDAVEGVAKSAICSVTYKCRRNRPTITWNYEDMQSSLHIKEIASNTYSAMSNLTFIGTLGDDGNLLTCTAKLISGETSASATIHVKSEFLHLLEVVSIVQHLDKYLHRGYGELRIPCYICPLNT